MLEAVGTWVGAGVTLFAVILGAIAYFSEEFARRREHRRQADATGDARRTEQQRLQLAADHVFCNISYAGTAPEVGPARVAVEELVIDVDNRSGSVVPDVVCELHLAAFEWSKVITEPIDTGKTVKRFPLLRPLQQRVRPSVPRSTPSHIRSDALAGVSGHWQCRRFYSEQFWGIWS